MPCHSEEPTYRGKESILVAKLLIYVREELELIQLLAINEVAESYFGDDNKL